jgi:glycosyltransferase 2 family protein
VKLKLPTIHPVLKKTLSYTLFLGVGAFFIYLAFREFKIDEVKDAIANANLWWPLLAMVAGIVSCISRAMRWQIIAEPLGYKTQLSTTFYGIMVGYMVNFAIPRGGEVARAAIVSRTEKIPMPTMIGTIVAERLVDLLCMGIVLILAVFLQLDTLQKFLDVLPKNENEAGGGLSLIQIGLIGMAVVGVLFIIFRKKIQKLSLYKKVVDLIKSFVEGIRGLLKIKKPIQFIIHSIIIWIMYYLMVYVCFFSLEGTSHLGPEAGLTVLVLSTVAILLPAPGGTGPFHYFVPFGLLLYGIPRETIGGAYAIIAHASQMVMFIGIGALSYFALMYQQRKQLAGETATENTQQDSK